MYTVNINHKGQKEATTYTIYRKEEAEKEGIRYVYWKMVQPGGYALSDDDYVAKCINRKSTHLIMTKTMYISGSPGVTLFLILSMLLKN